MPETGEKAPDFALGSDAGEEVSLKDLAGGPVVVYFYPKDDTSGCTIEALEFSALLPDFAAHNARVLGVSPDSVSSHRKFKNKHGLGVTLLSDPESKVAQSYGVWGEKSMYGRKYMGIERATFLIDKDGILARVWRKVKASGHAKEVLSTLASL